MNGTWERILVSYYNEVKCQIIDNAGEVMLTTLPLKEKV
jgi:hypothetical protein